MGSSRDVELKSSEVDDDYLESVYPNHLAYCFTHNGLNSRIGNSYYYFLFADCLQFYLQDENGESDLCWSPQENTDLLATSPGMIGIGTTDSTFVPVEVEIRDSAPNDDFGGWDHVTECSIQLSSGNLIVAGGTDLSKNAPRIHLRPISYRVRIYYGGLYYADKEALSDGDHYKVVLWPALDNTCVVLKRSIDLVSNQLC
jgi:hypothetical protein